MSKPIIMTSDLSMLPPAVTLTVASQYGHHRFPWFEEALKYISDYFTKVFGSQYQVLILTTNLSGAQAALNFENLKVLDVSNSLGADYSNFPNDSVDAYIIAPERVLMGVPGATVVVFKKSALDKLAGILEKLTIKPYSLDILKAYNVWEKKHSTPYSPSISSVVGLVAALNFIEEHGGLSQHVQRHQKWAVFMRHYLQASGLTVIEEQSFSNSFTVCRLPVGIMASTVVDKLAAENIFIESGTDPNSIKIGHLGYITEQSLEEFIRTFDKVLGHQSNISFEDIKKYTFDWEETASALVLNSLDEKLLTPGPSFFNPLVFDVLDQYTYYNSKQFKKDFFSLSDRLSHFLGSHNPTLILSAPSTGFMEAAVVSLTEQSALGLVVSHGKFGERFMEICQAKSRDYLALSVPEQEWGKAFSPLEIEKFLISQSKPIDFICFQQNETSSGVAYNQSQLIEISRAARKHNPEIIIIMDFVSGSFAHDINFDKTDIDVAIIGSQKGLGISSGIAFMMLSDRAISKLLKLAHYPSDWSKFLQEKSVDKYLDIFENKQQAGYLNVLKIFLRVAKKQIVDMPNIFHIHSALKSLDLIDKMGGQKAFLKHHEDLAKLTRQSIKDLGLQILGDKEYLSNSVTLVLFPDNIDASKIKKTLKEEYGLAVAGAQGDYWKSKFIRIGHMGYLSSKDIDGLFQAIKSILQSYKKM